MSHLAYVTIQSQLELINYPTQPFCHRFRIYESINVSHFVTVILDTYIYIIIYLLATALISYNLLSLK